MKQIAYDNIDLAAPSRVFRGRHKANDVSAVNGVTITRIVDGVTDTFLIAGPNVIPGYEIEARNVCGGVRSKKPTLVGKGGKASEE